MKTSPHQKPARQRLRRRLMGILAIAAVGGIAVAAFFQQSASAESAIPPGANFTSWADNGVGGQNVLKLVSGALPADAATTSGVVETDTNCEADAAGLSHCHNVIALANGGRIDTVHTHAMMTYPCLVPGDKVTVSKLDADWIVATVAP